MIAQTIAQTSNEYRVRTVTDGFRVLDKNQYNRGTFRTRQAAEDHILELTTARQQAHAFTRDLAQAGAVLLLALALLITPAGTAQARGDNICLRRTVTVRVYRAHGVELRQATITSCTPNRSGR